MKTYNYEEVKKRILISLSHPNYRAIEAQAWNKQFWYGFIFALSEYTNMTEEEAEYLNRMVKTY